MPFFLSEGFLKQKVDWNGFWDTTLLFKLHSLQMDVNGIFFEFWNRSSLWKFGASLKHRSELLLERALSSRQTLQCSRVHVWVRSVCVCVRAQPDRVHVPHKASIEPCAEEPLVPTDPSPESLPEGTPVTAPPLPTDNSPLWDTALTDAPPLELRHLQPLPNAPLSGQNLSGFKHAFNLEV